MVGEGTHGANGGGGGVSVLRRKRERAEAKGGGVLSTGKRGSVVRASAGSVQVRSQRDWRGKEAARGDEPAANGGGERAGNEQAATSIGEGYRRGVTAHGRLNLRHCQLGRWRGSVGDSNRHLTETRVQFGQLCPSVFNEENSQNLNCSQSSVITKVVEGRSGYKFYVWGLV